MKALNLFFNGDTDWGTSLEFYRDFSTRRHDVVRSESIKGKQFVSVALEFQRPQGFSGSLPMRFVVTRTWHRQGERYTESTNLPTLDKQGKLPSTLETARRFASVFINRVHYEYVPAIKDRLYYDSILSRLQKTLLDLPTDADSGVAEVAKRLANDIQGKISDLQDDFQRTTGIKSQVIPPAELSSLFRAFGVSTKTIRGYDVPLALRGDGVQTRYITSVLSYICGNSNDFFIWGFEEPENSLEYSLVESLAKDFENFYSSQAQVLLTTHSP